MKNNQSGRSMVEMLGVLAIIGILSAGALKGYSDAMFKYKMNQTIDEATQIFQRFEELNAKDWGATAENIVEISTWDDSAVSWGLLEKCDRKSGFFCRLPIGAVSIDVMETTEEGLCYGDESAGHFGVFSFSFADAKSCVAFASAHFEQMLPQEWWNPHGLMEICGQGLYWPSEGITTFPTTSEIANACQKQRADGNYVIGFVYRYFC